MPVRTERLNKELQKSITQIIRDKVKDPRVSGVMSVTSVSVTSDLKFAKVYVSTLSGEERVETLAALNNSAGFIRSELASAFKHIRTVPKLTFFEDSSIDYGTKIDTILKEIGQKDAD